MGTLYIVGTPIGNLEDISARALRILKEADLIAAEDTRRTRKLLTHFEISTALTSYFEHNKLSKLDIILAALRNGNVALVSDGGMPGISDPGYELINAAIETGHKVTPVPGPSAIATALVASGLPADAFVFLGFLPRRSAARRALLVENVNDRRTLIAFESPHRLQNSLHDIATELGNRKIAIARELTKLHEEIFRGNVQEACEHFSPSEARGEITLVIAGAAPDEIETWTETQVRSALSESIAEGASPTTAAKKIANKSGWPRRSVYRLAVETTK